MYSQKVSLLFSLFPETLSIADSLREREREPRHTPVLFRTFPSERKCLSIIESHARLRADPERVLRGEAAAESGEVLGEAGGGHEEREERGAREDAVGAPGEEDREEFGEEGTEALAPVE